MSDRTYSISRRSQRIKIFLIVVTVIITLLEWFTNLYGRVMIQTDGKCVLECMMLILPDIGSAVFSSCTSGNDPSKLVNWTFYIWAMLSVTYPISRADVAVVDEQPFLQLRYDNFRVIHILFDQSWRLRTVFVSVQPSHPMFRDAEYLLSV